MSNEGLREARGVAPQNTDAAPKASGERGFFSRNVVSGLALLSLVAYGAYALGRNGAESDGNEQSADEAKQALCTDIEGVTGAKADYSGYRVSSGENINLGPASPGSDELAIADYLPTPNVAIDDTKAVSPYIAMMKELLNKKDTDGNGGFTDDQTKDVIAAANARKRSYVENGEVDVKALQADCKDVTDDLKTRFDVSSKAIKKGVKYVEYIYKENEDGNVSYETRVFRATEDVEGMVDTKEGSSLRAVKGKDQDGEFDGSIRVFTEYDPSQGASQEKLDKHHKVVKKTFINAQGQKVTVKQVIDTRTGKTVPAKSNNSSSGTGTGGGTGTGPSGPVDTGGGPETPPPVVVTPEPVTPSGSDGKTPPPVVVTPPPVVVTPPPVVVTPGPVKPPIACNPKIDDCN